MLGKGLAWKGASTRGALLQRPCVWSAHCMDEGAEASRRWSLPQAGAGGL